MTAAIFCTDLGLYDLLPLLLVKGQGLIDKRGIPNGCVKNTKASNRKGDLISTKDFSVDG